MPCPTCGTVQVPVSYGFPSVVTVEQAGRGEVVLGGCRRPVEPAPPLACPRCTEDGRPDVNGFNGLKPGAAIRDGDPPFN